MKLEYIGIGSRYIYPCIGIYCICVLDWHLDHMCAFGIWIIFFAGKSIVGAVLDWTALTNTHSRGGWWYSRPYRGHCRGGWKHQPPLQRALQGRSGNRPYKGTLCRNTLGRAAGAAAPTVKFCSSEKEVTYDWLISHGLKILLADLVWEENTVG